jgi:hypothetical protein
MNAHCAFSLRSRNAKRRVEQFFMKRLLVSFASVLVACSGPGGFNEDGGTPKDSGGDQSTNNDGSTGFGDSSLDSPTGGDGGVSIIYANTDDTLYTLDPQSNAITLVGKFAGMSGTTNDTNVTDLAVNSSGDVYVNTESVIYKATIPTSPATVNLTKIAGIALKTNQKFYALAFTPANSLATSEILIGGDGFGELYAIDTTNGKTKDLGDFGPDPSHSGYNFALSGDLVFYMDAKNTPTGLATVRPCKVGTTTCITTTDYLVAVDMTALANAYNTTAGASLKKGIYGGTSTNDGAGTGYPDLFGLGAWEGSVFAFARKAGTNQTALLVTINTTTGAGTVVSSNFSFSNGWSGAGVTTSATITVPPPN